MSTFLKLRLKPLRNDRQVHVQEVRRSDGRIAIFAHTEPADLIGHAISALADGANFSAGSRSLKPDLRKRGWRL